MNAAIKSISYFLPPGELGHGELAARFGEAAMEKIERASGILTRRVADSSTCASDLAFSAAELLFKNSPVGRGDVGLLVMATQSPDYLLPTTACILQDRLGLPQSCAAFDVNLGCSQYVYGAAVASAWIRSKMAENVLLLTADTPSRTINPRDRSAVTLFGDGASATLFSASESGGLLDFVFGTDGSSHGDLILPCSGFRHPPAPEDFIEHDDGTGCVRANRDLYINGFRIFAFAYRAAFESVSALLKRNSLSVGDVGLFIFHQAGEKIVRAVAERLGVPDSKLHFKMRDIGNCGGSSVGVALADAALSGKLEPGMKVVLCAFGVGLSWGAALLEWTGDFCGAFTAESECPAK